MDRNIKITNFPKILQARQNYEIPGYLQVNEIQDQMLQWKSRKQLKNAWKFSWCQKTWSHKFQGMAVALHPPGDWAKPLSNSQTAIAIANTKTNTFFKSWNTVKPLFKGLFGQRQTVA